MLFDDGFQPANQRVERFAGIVFFRPKSLANLAFRQQMRGRAEKHFHTVAGHPPAERCDGIATHIQTEEVRTDDAAKQLCLAAMQRRGRDDGVAGQATATQQAAPENMQRIESGGGIDANPPQPIRLT